jgi:hypothetical protein
MALVECPCDARGACIVAELKGRAARAFHEHFTKAVAHIVRGVDPNIDCPPERLVLDVGS